MNTVSVFRVEHPKLGRGPWFAAELLYNETGLTEDEEDAVYAAADAMNAHWKLNLTRYPNPFGDNISFNTTSHFCASKTLTELRKWFRVTADYIDALFDAGFTVMEYVVPVADVLEGGVQVAFSKANVIKAIDHTLLALFNK